MKFSIATICSLLGSALAISSEGKAELFQLKVKSNDCGLDGTSVSLLHEGAGINFAFIDTPYAANSFYLQDSILFSQVEGMDFPCGSLIYSSFLEVGILTDPETKSWQTGYSLDDDEVLRFGGQDDFYACSGADDPYHYEFKAVMFYPENAPDNCEKISLVKA